MVKRVRFVTFPRSGHHWLVSMLELRGIEGWCYDEHHTTGNTLENCPWITAQKTHDFQLNVPKVNEFVHIVQIRSRAPSIASWCKVKKCTERMLFRVAGVQRDFRHQWIEKWLVDPVPNRIVVRYEELARDPQRMVDYIVSKIV